MENILDYVKEKWTILTAFSKKEEVKKRLWDEIVYRYSEQHRHHHNLSHISFIFSLCDKHLNNIKNPAVTGFAILYHDLVYDTYRADNEEQSAALAEMHLEQLNLNPSIIQNVAAFILATKNHEIPDNYPLKEDLALFLDFDMAILAAEPEMYEMYSENIRQEYSKYDDGVYKEGRKLALQKILASENIFATNEFRENMEKIARENINKEVSLL